MTLQECYTALEGNYEEVLSRLGSERLIQKFVLKFPDDPSFRLLCDSMDCQDWDEAFRGAHTIKGVCQNLGFTLLGQSSSQLCEALRGGFHPEAPTLAQQVKADYEKTVAAIRAYQASMEI